MRKYKLPATAGRQAFASDFWSFAWLRLLEASLTQVAMTLSVTMSIASLLGLVSTRIATRIVVTESSITMKLASFRTNVLRAERCRRQLSQAVSL